MVLFVFPIILPILFVISGMGAILTNIIAKLLEIPIMHKNQNKVSLELESTSTLKNNLIISDSKLQYISIDHL